MASSTNWKSFKRNPFLRAGLPMLLFMVLGFAGLEKFVQGKRELEDLSRGRRSFTKREFDLEEDYKKTMKKLNTDYDLKPIPKED